MKTKIAILKIFLIVLMLTSCVQKEHLKEVTFEVDMNETTHNNQVGLKGEFTSPPWSEVVPMEDNNGDGIFEVTLSQKTAQNSVEFKFVNNGEEIELNGQPNRRIRFEYKPERITYSGIFNKENGKQIIN
ncbi:MULTISPECIES: hypothetical protein [Croceitalea]|uniref:Lipoprotein n=1 Tax=Croceitalea vernalis TaxID=3075599 RepID=A0ABU3BHM3_9FLAO|nr:MULTISPECIES: hypothetical protein [unclassified Croceitalea]MDT0539841.1 hypothetical protein [Croceitalea sp. P059]MDT0621657.1 hypothetical protein [Croceitalea sp. P007]